MEPVGSRQPSRRLSEGNMTDDDIILMYRKGYSIKKIVDVYSRFYNADKNRIYQFGKSAEKIDVFAYVSKVIFNFNRNLKK